MNSGDSDASGASHCTSKNSSIPKRRPVASKPSANGSAAIKIVTAATAKSAMAAMRRPATPRPASTSDTPSSSGSTTCARAAVTA